MTSNRRIALILFFLVLIAAGMFTVTVEFGSVDDDAYLIVPIVGGLVGIASCFGLVATLLHRDHDAAEVAAWADIRTAGRSVYIRGFVAKSVIPVLAGVLLSLGYTYANGHPLSSEEMFTKFGLGVFVLAALALVRLAVWNSNETRFGVGIQDLKHEKRSGHFDNSP